MMREQGVAALSFNEIARQLGIRPPSLYTYFPSKDAIYDELFRRGFVEFGRRMQARDLQDGSIRTRMRSALETYFTFALENPDLFQLMFQRPVPGFVPSARSMAASLAALEAGYQEIAAIVGAEGLNPEMPRQEAADLTIALIHGLTELHLANNPELPLGEGRFGRLVSRAVDLLMAAWKTKGESTEEKRR
jgi:AcrR family transcriptional regulator